MDVKVQQSIFRRMVDGLHAPRTINWMRICFWASGIIFLWVGSAAFLSFVFSEKPHPGAIPPSLGDLATIFFGASSLALIIFSLLLAVAAIIEWQSLKTDIRKQIEAAEAAEKRVARMEKDLRGRSLTIMGLMMGTLHSDPLAEKQNPKEKDYLAEALYYCQKGYNALKDLDGNGKYMALNNILHYSCLLDLESRSDILLAQAKEIRDLGEKYEDSQYISPYLMTYCRVALTFETDLEELKKARAKADSVLEMNLTSLQRKEAAMIAASLAKKLARLSVPAS
jgi:hypothetical protein